MNKGQFLALQKYGLEKLAFTPPIPNPAYIGFKTPLKYPLISGSLLGAGLGALGGVLYQAGKDPDAHPKEYLKPIGTGMLTGALLGGPFHALTTHLDEKSNLEMFPYPFKST